MKKHKFFAWKICRICEDPRAGGELADRVK